MFNAKLFQATLSAVTLLAASVPIRPAHAQSAPASFLVVHGIPGRDVAAGLDPLLPVDVLVAGKYCLLQGLTYGTIAGPFDIPAGTYAVDVSLANPLAPCSNSAVIKAIVTLTPGEYGAVVAAISTRGAPTAEIYPIDVTPVTAGMQRFITAHAADAPTVVVRAISLGKDPEKAKFFLKPGAENVTEVPTRDAFELSAAVGTTILGPVTVKAGTQADILTVAVGTGSTGSATLLTKVIPSVH